MSDLTFTTVQIPFGTAVNRFSVCPREPQITCEHLQALLNVGYTVAAIQLGQSSIDAYPQPAQLILVFTSSDDNVNGTMAKVIWSIFPHGDTLCKVSP